MFWRALRYFKSAELYGSIPKVTLTEQKRKAWGDSNPAFRITADADQRQQWKRLQIVKRRQA